MTKGNGFKVNFTVRTVLYVTVSSNILYSSTVTDVKFVVVSLAAAPLLLTKEPSQCVVEQLSCSEGDEEKGELSRQGSSTAATVLTRQQ